MLSAVDWSTKLGIAYDIVVITGAIFGASGVVFSAHRRTVERRKHDAETRELVDELHVVVKDHSASLARIEKKLTMNGKNTSNPGDLLGLICDTLGIEIPE
jgi:hypothetical protein